MKQNLSSPEGVACVPAKKSRWFTVTYQTADGCKFSCPAWGDDAGHAADSFKEADIENEREIISVTPRAPSPAESVPLDGPKAVRIPASGLDSSSADVPPVDDMCCPSCGVVLAEFQDSCDACGSPAHAMEAQELPTGWTLTCFPSTVEICDASGKLVHGHPVPYEAISEADLKAQAIRFALDPCLRSTSSKTHAENGLQLHYKTVVHPSGGEWKPVSAPVQTFGMHPGETCNRLGCKGEMEHQGGVGFACPVCGIAVGFDSQDVPVTPSPVDEDLMAAIKQWKRSLESSIEGLLPESPDVRRTTPKITALERVIDHMEACDSENEELSRILKECGASDGEMLTAFLARLSSSHAAHLAKIQALTDALNLFYDETAMHASMATCDAARTALSLPSA